MSATAVSIGPRAATYGEKNYLADRTISSNNTLMTR